MATSIWIIVRSYYLPMGSVLHVSPLDGYFTSEGAARAEANRISKKMGDDEGTYHPQELTVRIPSVLRPLPKPKLQVPAYVAPDPVHFKTFFGLKLTTRAYYCITANDIHNVEELVKYGAVNMMRTPNIGWKSLEVIQIALVKRGLSFLDIDDARRNYPTPGRKAFGITEPRDPSVITTYYR